MLSHGPVSIQWQLPGGIKTYQDLEKPDGWGTSHFWYCVFCGETYAYAIIPKRIWRAVSGCCPTCPGNRWTVPGSLESLATVGWEVPLPVALYQLRCEISFLDSPEYPKETNDGDTTERALEDFLSS